MKLTFHSSWATWVVLFLGMHALPASADTITKKSSFGYDDQGFLIRETVEPDIPNSCVTTNYTLDGFGNKISKNASSCSGVSGPSGWSSAARTTSSTYSSDGHFLVTTSNALGHGESRSYTATGQISSLTGPNGLSTTWEYDGFARKIKETRADGTYTTWSYVRCPLAGANCPATIGGVAPLWVQIEKHFRTTGSVNMPEQRQYFDAQNRLLRAQKEGFTDAQGSIPIWAQDIEYDSLGRVSRKSNNYDPNISVPLWSDYSYDSIDRVVQERKPSSDTLGSLAVTAYQFNGLTTSVTNPAGQTQTTIKDAQGKVATVTDASSNSISFIYDAEGRVISTNAGGSITTSTYDRRGNKIGLVDPEMGSWTYAYNVFGELVLQTDSLNRSSTVVYDKLGRMTKRIESDLVSEWSLDKMFDGSACGKSIGALCEAKADNGYRRVNTYDSLARIISTSNSLDNSPTLATISVIYSAESGRIAYRTWPTGFQAAYAYTSRGYPQHVEGGGNAGFPETLSMTVDAMDPNGNITAYRQGGQLIRTNKVFNQATSMLVGQTVTKDGAGVGNMVKHAYSYDNLDNLLQRADDSAGAGIKESFSYDNLNRLREYLIVGNEVSPPKTINVLYDARGNITYKSDVGQYFYDPSRRNRLTSITLAAPTGAPPNTGTRALSFAFDDAGGNVVNGIATGNGNVIETISQDAINSRHTYRRQSYTSFNMPLTTTFGSVVNGVPGATERTLNFTYGPEHQRIKQQVQLSAGAPPMYKPSTTWYLNGEDSLGLAYEKEVFASGMIEHRHFVSLAGMVFAVRTVRSGSLGGQPVTSGRYFHHDHLGSISAISDETGAVVERLAFDPWGKRRQANGNSDPLDQLIGQNTSRGFTMHEHLDEVGTIHMNGRVYDPLIGRFLSADPYVQGQLNLQSYNRYSYVLNNPLAYSDPSGHFSFKRFLRGIVGAVVGYFVGPWFGSFFGPAGGLANNIASGAAGGFTGGVISSGTLKGGLYGGLTGGAFGAVGFYGKSWSTPTVVAAHAAVGCVSQSIGGGSCKAGALSAGFAKWATVEGYDFKDTFLNGVKATVIGGTASVLGGGKFEDGAATAAFGYAFNELSAATRAKIVAGGGALGFAAGTAGAAVCTGGTAGVCALGAGPIILGGTALGMATGNAVANTVDALTESVHGNDTLSPKPTTVYQLISNITGEVMKYGITGENDPSDRYAATYYAQRQVTMVPIATFESRLPARMLEVMLCSNHVIQHGKLPSYSARC